MRGDWEIYKIGDVCDVYNGSTPLRSKKEYWENGSINWFTIDDIREQGRVINKTAQKITPEGYKNSSLNLLPKNTVLLCCTASVGEYAITNVELTTNQQFNGLVVKEGFDLLPEYLFYFSSTLKQRLLSVSGKTTIDYVSMTKLRNVEVPIPPLPDQKRIVAILDEAFEVIEQAEANIERNIENAEELFQSKLNEIFSQRGEGWEETTLGEMCSVLNGYAFKSKEAIDSSGTQLLRMGNLYQNELDLDRRPVFYPDSYAEEYDKFVLNEGDLIMSLTGTVDKRDYGYTVELPETDVTLLLNQRIMKIIIDKPDLINKSFLKGYLLSPFFLDKLYETASGTRQANLSSRKIMKLPFYYPCDIQTQKNIVDVIQSLKEVTNSIVLNNKKRRSNIEELKKSILQKAFSGELTANEYVAA